LSVGGRNASKKGRPMEQFLGATLVVRSHRQGPMGTKVLILREEAVAP
jgi:hypothetical protein